MWPRRVDTTIAEVIHFSNSDPGSETRWSAANIGELSQPYLPSWAGRDRGTTSYDQQAAMPFRILAPRYVALAGWSCCIISDRDDQKLEQNWNRGVENVESWSFESKIAARLPH